MSNHPSMKFYNMPFLTFSYKSSKHGERKVTFLPERLVFDWDVNFQVSDAAITVFILVCKVPDKCLDTEVPKKLGDWNRMRYTD